MAYKLLSEVAENGSIHTSGGSLYYKDPLGVDHLLTYNTLKDVVTPDLLKNFLSNLETYQGVKMDYFNDNLESDVALIDVDLVNTPVNFHALHLLILAYHEVYCRFFQIQDLSHICSNSVKLIDITNVESIKFDLWGLKGDELIAESGVIYCKDSEGNPLNYSTVKLSNFDVTLSKESNNSHYLIARSLEFIEMSFNKLIYKYDESATPSEITNNRAKMADIIALEGDSSLIVTSDGVLIST